ncbi:MAG TPA: hypothetical protein VM182_05980 [Terriglobia bacterium]|nr:hypothetical protein [Terriglobia bacterium]
MKRAAAVLTWLLAGAMTAAAQQDSGPAKAPAFEFQLGGYYKNLFTASKSFVTGETFGDSLNRLRLSLDGRHGESVLFHIEFDNEAHFGNLNTLPDFELVRRRQDATYFDLLHPFVDEDHVYWDTSLYRGSVTIRNARAALTLGRQRIGWGTARFWSPVDVFNPLSPLQIESEERVGVDAAQLEVNVRGNAVWTLVYAPQNGFNRSITATRLSSTIRNTDVAGFVGRFGRDWVAGAEFASQVGGAGLRGEATYTWRHQQSEQNALRVVFGSDYAFTNTLYLVGEYFYNQGQPAGFVPGEPFDPSVLLRFTREIFTLRRHFLSGGARYEVTPLFHVEGYTVVELQGPSSFFMPLARYNLTPNTDLTVGGQLFASSATGEFHGLHNLFFVEFLAHF